MTGWVVGVAAIGAMGLGASGAAAGVPSVPSWPQFRHDVAHSGSNPVESTITAANVSTLHQAWTAPTGDTIFSSPAVAGGVVYVGSNDHNLYAFDASGTAGCSGTAPTKVCTPLWTATTGSGVFSSPAVAGGVVYVGSFDAKLYAFDASGTTGCTGTAPTKVCAPLWTAATGTLIESSPAVAGGVVYVGSDDHNLYAFDASGTTGCSGTAPTKVCAPLWTAATGSFVRSSPAVAGGVVYVGSDDKSLHAFGRPDSDLGLAGVPSDITVASTSSSGAPVTYPAPSATDEEPGATVGCAPLSGSVFPIGTTTVTCTATDADDLNSPVTATFKVTVVGPPQITKSFGASNIALNGSTTLSFTIDNPAGNTDLTGVGFTDTFPAGLVVASPNGLTGDCGGGTITAAAGSGTVSLADATLSAGTGCTFTVNVTGTTAGAKANSVTVTSTNAGKGNTATATVTVGSPPHIAKS
ncbi:MAG: PQQ-binding-like beta-propeller repeat protein, partial [Actinomycetota bacterium]|nr:PQQ-binding-like beta-propeller repeat protein [Actinomycetota bacterium]